MPACRPATPSCDVPSPGGTEAPKARSWCPTCRQQRPIVEQIEKEKPTLVVYEVDFDSAKETLKRFHVQYQSTLIVFKGVKEIGRSTGDTDPARIRALIAQGF